MSDKIVRAARRWRVARLAASAAQVHDVRADKSFAAILNELSEAEDGLSKAVADNATMSARHCDCFRAAFAAAFPGETAQVISTGMGRFYVDTAQIRPATPDPRVLAGRSVSLDELLGWIERLERLASAAGDDR